MTRETLPPAPLTFRELAADLLWPKLLAATAMGFRPASIGLAFLLVVSLMAVGEAFDAIHGALADVQTPVFAALASSPSAELATRAMALISAHPIASTLLGLLLLPVWCLFGLAMCRLMVTDAGMTLRLSAPEGLGFALPRLGSAIGAYLIPLIFAAALALLAWLVGLLGALPLVDVVGALLHSLVLAFSALIVLLLVALAIGSPLLLPAIAAESADAFDAVQRAYAYVLGRTGRFLLYALVAAALLVVTSLAIQWIGATTLLLAERLASGPSESSPSASVAESIRAIWTSAFRALIGAIIVSVFFSLSSTLLLLCRRVNDEQDLSDIWMPTDPDGARR